MNAAYQVEEFRNAVDGYEEPFLTLALDRIECLRKQVEHDGGMSEEDALAFIDAVERAMERSADALEDASDAEAEEAA